MKPTFPTIGRARRRDASSTIGHHQTRTPRTDWSFQAPDATIRGGAASITRPAFRTLSNEFFAVEAHKVMRIETILFGIIIAMTTWPIALAAQAAYGLMK